MRALDQRDKDHRALELESVLEELKKNVKENDDFETMTNVSMQEIKELKEDNRKQINIYKPTLKGGKPQQPPPMQNFYPQLGFQNESKQNLDDSQSSIMSERIVLPD